MTTCPSGVQLHAPRRSRPAPYRGALPPALRERLLRRLLGAGADPPGPAARGAAPGAARQSRSPGSRRRCCARCWRWRRGACRRPRRSHWIEIFPAEGERRMRVALLPGCAQQVLAPEINLATIRLLTRHGVRGRCRAGQRLLRRADPSSRRGERRRSPWRAPISTPGRRRAEAGGLDAVVANASGCGTMLKDYGFLLRADPSYAEKAARIAGLARDVSEIVAALGLRAADRHGPGAARRLSLGLLVAARAEDRPRAESAARRRRVRGARRARRASVLRLGRHLQHAAAGTRRGAARPQARQYRADPARCRRGRQYRLHHAARRRATRRCRSCTRSNCSIGRPAARRRRAWPGAGRRSSRRIGAFSSLPNYRIRSARIDSGEGAVAVRWVLTDDRALALAAKLSAEIRTAVRHRPAG